MDELGFLEQSHSYDIIGISKTWRDESCDWGVTIDSYRLLRKDRQGRRGGEGGNVCEAGAGLCGT